jgi:hypothetical protein
LIETLGDLSVAFEEFGSEGAGGGGDGIGAEEMEGLGLGVEDEEFEEEFFFEGSEQDGAAEFEAGGLEVVFEGGSNALGGGAGAWVEGEVHGLGSFLAGADSCEGAHEHEGEGIHGTGFVHSARALE